MSTASSAPLTKIEKDGVRIGTGFVPVDLPADFPERLVKDALSALGAFYRRVLVEVIADTDKAGNDTASVKFIFPATDSGYCVNPRGDLLGLDYEQWLARRGGRHWIDLVEPPMTKD